MERKRISLQDLVVGEPVPWDAFSADGILLLRRGQTVASQQALARLIEEGLFLHDDAGRRVDPSSEQEKEKPTAMQHLVDARRSLSYLYQHGPEQSGDFCQRIDRLVDSVDCASTLHPALSASSILLMHDVAYLVKHAVDTAILANLLAREMKLDDAARHATVAATLTMNIGMCEVQEKVDAIPGKLNDKLVAMIHLHPERGVERLIRLGVTDAAWLDCVRQHHENSDGSGYPAGLADDAIGIGARIVGVADRYCAMVSRRAYRGPLKPNQALRDLCVKQGRCIDVTVAATLIRIVGIYPVGTLVRLKSAEIGVVTGPGEAPETPAVHAVIAKSGLFLEVASYRKTHRAETAIEEVIALDSLTTPIRMANVWGKEARFT